MSTAGGNTTGGGGGSGGPTGGGLMMSARPLRSITGGGLASSNNGGGIAIVSADRGALPLPTTTYNNNASSSSNAGGGGPTNGGTLQSAAGQPPLQPIPQAHHHNPHHQHQHHPHQQHQSHHHQQQHYSMHQQQPQLHSHHIPPLPTPQQQQLSSSMQPQPPSHRSYGTGKLPFFGTNTQHNSNSVHHYQHHQQHQQHQSSSAAYGSSNSISAACHSADISLPHKAGPAYFNFSRQRYTPYYSRSFSNSSTTSSNGGGGGGNGGSSGDCARWAMPPPAPPPTQQSGNPVALLNSTADSGFAGSATSCSSSSSASLSSLSSGHACSSASEGINNSSTAGGSDAMANQSLNCSSTGMSSQNSSLMSCNQQMLPLPAQLMGSTTGSVGLQQQQQQQPADNSVTLQISNIDTSIEDRALKHYLLGKLKPLTPIMSFAYEGLSMVKIRVPSQHYAKQVVSYLHRKKIGHKRITVSYTRDSSTMEPSTLRCQVAGLLKDIPFYKLSMYKFRELFQSRFKTSISVMDLYDMKDICTITENANDEKCISLRVELISSIENSELLGCLQLSVPYCTAHFKSGHRGWAELEIEPLPNVWMSVTQVRQIVYDLLKRHKGDIPIASLVYCVEAELGVQIERTEAGVNLEHLISCVNGVHITTNKFGIKILSWLAANAKQQLQQQQNQQQNQQPGLMGYDDQQSYQQQPMQQPMMGCGSRYTKFANVADPFGQISREIVELVKMSPKSTMKFSRFIPAYHNHFGKQCRVADYGYTKLIELFEALSGIVQIMGDGENRQITLTHKCQIRCFTTDLLRVLRSQPSKAMPMGHLEALFAAPMAPVSAAAAMASVAPRKFEITDYGVCDMEDILESLVHNNVVCIERSAGGFGGEDVCMVAIPKRRQTRLEVQKTCTFAGEVVELLRNSSQYSIPFEKFACSYHYNYGYQCRLSDYGFLKLTDLMEAITGVVEIEVCNDEDRKVSLSARVAQRVFSEQLRDLTKMLTASSTTPMNLSTLLFYHKKQFGYQMQPQSLGIGTMWYAIKDLPYVELTGTTANDDYIVVCRHEDAKFVFNGYAACRVILTSGKWALPMANFIDSFFAQYSQIINEQQIDAMNHAVEIFIEYGAKYVRISPLMVFVLRIISVLEMMNVVSVNDLKSILNLGIADCFPYGYPNFAALLQSFGDVFLSSSAQIGDMSEIVLNKQCILAKNGVQECLRQGGGGGSGQYFGAPNMTQMDAMQMPQQQQQQQQPQSWQSARQQQICGSGRIFIPPTAVSMPPPAAPASQPQSNRFDSTWAPTAFDAAKFAAPPGFRSNVSTTLSSSEATSSMSTSTRSSLNATVGDETVDEDVSVDESVVKAPSPVVVKSKATEEKENFYFNIMQSSDFDISVIEKLFFKTSSPEPILSDPPKVAEKDTKANDESESEKSTDAADEAEDDPAVDDKSESVVIAPIGPKRVPLYERKPSADWLLKHPEPATPEKDAKAAEVAKDGAGDETTTTTKLTTIDEVSTTPPAPVSLFDPPKPDTPPSNVPFWMDPVWRHDSPTSPANATKTPLEESLNIAIPELKLFEGGLPALDTPTVMQDLLAHNPNMFTFDF